MPRAPVARAEKGLWSRAFGKPARGNRIDDSRTSVARASFGNQGIALRILAEWRGDLVAAEQALTRISAAVDTYRQGNDARAKFYNTWLSTARALVERLRKHE
jgi:hypothetical protein